MSLYGIKTAQAAVQPWAQVVTLAEAGKGCDGLFSLYDSLGDKTLVGANSVSTMLDGPEKVVRYGALTLGDGTTPTSLTAANRCKGLVILCDSLLVRANATLHMTGKGARVQTNDDPFFPFVDYRVPFKIALESSSLSPAAALASFRKQGLAPWDQGTWQHLVAPIFGFNLGITLAGSTVLLLATGGGGGGNNGYVGAGSHAVGYAGGAGSNGGCGGGGGGGAAGQYGSSGTASGRMGSQGCPYSGGSGGGAGCAYGGYAGTTGSPPPAGRYSGAGGGGGIQWTSPGVYAGDAGGGAGGGGAGNPGGFGAGGDANGGNGTGGKLTIICRGAITVQSGGKIEANGMPGGGGISGGGGSGGGHISIIAPSAPSNAGTIQAAGGTGGVGYGAAAGGAGGAGSVVTKTFSDMGW